MIIKEAIKQAIEILNKKHNDIKLSHLEANILLCYSLNFTKIDLINRAYDEIEKEKINYFFSLVEERVNNKPIAYITNKKEFYGREYYVDSNVLIPRPETEELIDQAKEYIKPKDSVIDIGTGSGVIAITIKDIFKQLEVTALDISKKGLEIAKKNARNILGDNNINFINADCLIYESEKKYDVLLSNPPYVAIKDKYMLGVDLDYEPSIALFAGESGLDFYIKFLPLIHRYLKEGGVFIFEIGYDQGESLIDICKKNNIDNVFIKKDLSDNDRFLICRKFNKRV